MKFVYVFPCLFALAMASSKIQIDSEDLKNILNSNLKDIKIDLPNDVVNDLSSLGLHDGEERVAGITALVNNYVDKTLANIQNLIIRRGYDPYGLPNSTLNLIPTGTITLSSGWLQDTSTITRNGNVTVTYSSSTKNMEMNLPVKFESLLFTYKYKTKILLLSIAGDANGKVDGLKISIKLSFNYGTYRAALDNFDITDTGRFSLVFKGNALVDWITNTMTSVVTVFLQPIIIRIIQLMVKGGLEGAVETINSFIASILSP